MFAKFAKRMLVAVVISITTASIARAARQTECPRRYGVDDTNLSRTLDPLDPSVDLNQPCPNNLCWAIRDLECAMDAMAHQLLPNTMNYRNPREAEYYRNLYRRNIQALGQEHRRRIHLYCRLLARVAATIRGEDKLRDRTAYNLTEMGIRLDRPGNHCLAQVVAAVPKTKAAQDAMVYARGCVRRIRTCQAGLDPPLR